MENVLTVMDECPVITKNLELFQKNILANGAITNIIA
jgi:hypothetical protein